MFNRERILLDRRNFGKFRIEKAFDLVIDTCAYTPSDLAILSSMSLSQYLLISTVGVYCFPINWVPPIIRIFTDVPPIRWGDRLQCRVNPWRRVGMKIDDVEIGVGFPPYIIAEMSGNHQGSLDKAMELLRKCVEAGANAFKLQTYTADSLTIDSSRSEYIVSEPYGFSLVLRFYCFGARAPMITNL